MILRCSAWSGVSQLSGIECLIGLREDARGSVPTTIGDQACIQKCIYACFGLHAKTGITYSVANIENSKKGLALAPGQFWVEYGHTPKSGPSGRSNINAKCNFVVPAGTRIMH